MTEEHDDDRVVDYLRERGQIRVPQDLLERATARAVGAPAAHSPNAAVRGLSLGAAAILVAVVALLVVNLPANVPIASSNPSNAALAPTTSALPHQSAEVSSPPSASASSAVPTQTAVASNSPQPSTLMPATVLGMPVLTVAQAVQLLDSGQLNGQAVAVAGYFGYYPLPSCHANAPADALESYACRMQVLTDAQSDAVLCHSKRNEETCALSGPNGVPYIVPIMLPETGIYPFDFRPDPDPIQMVAVGHAGDPRSLQCPAVEEADCAKAFVVDRIAWAEGHDLPVTAPDPGISQSISPRMSLDEVGADLGLGDSILTGIALNANDVWTIDPRWNLAGDEIVWLVRSLQPGQVGSAQTRSETVWLVDDSTGKLQNHEDLAIAADYDPARLWPALSIGYSCCYEAFYQVSTESSMFNGASRIPCGLPFDGTCTAGVPIVLDPGSYTAGEWLVPVGNDGTTFPPVYGCSTQITLKAGDDVTLIAAFPPDESCSFSPPSPYSPSPSPR